MLHTRSSSTNACQKQCAKRTVAPTPAESLTTESDLMKKNQNVKVVEGHGRDPIRIGGNWKFESGRERKLELFQSDKVVKFLAGP